VEFSVYSQKEVLDGTVVYQVEECDIPLSPESRILPIKNWNWTATWPDGS